LPRPKAIVVVSAHWFTRGTGVTAMETPKTIHDFGGFPQALMTRTIRHRARLHWQNVWSNCWRLFL
jgi:aromatic ring-opening dioxygenase catalytic subunit (LigB family)